MTNIAKAIRASSLTFLRASFHWMDRPIVLEKIYSSTASGGGVAIVSNYTRDGGPNFGQKWKEARTELVRRYSGNDRRAGKGIFERGNDAFSDRLDQPSFGGGTRCGIMTMPEPGPWTKRLTISILHHFSSGDFLGIKSRILKANFELSWKNIQLTEC